MRYVTVKAIYANRLKKQTKWALNLAIFLFDVSWRVGNNGHRSAAVANVDKRLQRGPLPAHYGSTAKTLSQKYGPCKTGDK